MMGKTFASIVLGFSLGVALPAAAGDRSPHRGNDGVVSMAKRFEKAVHEAYCEAAELHLRNMRDRRVVSALQDLDAQARRFRRRVERDGIHDRDARRELRRLEDAFHRAQSRAPRLYHVKRFQRDFQRVEEIASRLEKRVVAAHERHREKLARAEARRREELARAEARRREERHARAEARRRDPHVHAHAWDRWDDRPLLAFHWSFGD